MKKGVLITALALLSLLALNWPVSPAFASEPNVVITPSHGLPGDTFTFVITATSGSTVSGVTVEDPEGNTWLLEMQINGEDWKPFYIYLLAGDSIQLTWPDASDPVFTTTWIWPTMELRWTPIDDGVSPHTIMMGTYSLSFSGYGCKYFHVDSFFVVPEGPFGTIGAVITMFSVFALQYRKHQTRA